LAGACGRRLLAGACGRRLLAGACGRRLLVTACGRRLLAGARDRFVLSHATLFLRGHDGRVVRDDRTARWPIVRPRGVVLPRRGWRACGHLPRCVVLMNLRGRPLPPRMTVAVIISLTWGMHADDPRHALSRLD